MGKKDKQQDEDDIETVRGAPERRAGPPKPGEKPPEEPEKATEKGAPER